MLYFQVGSLLLRILGLFIKTDPNLILFISYGGQKYDDSPKVVYEYLQQHPVSQEHRFVWAFIEPEKFPQIDVSKQEVLIPIIVEFKNIGVTVTIPDWMIHDVTPDYGNK